MTNKPEDLKYTKSHEWLKLDDGVAIIGLSDYASEQLGDIVHVELPQPDDEFGKGDAFGVVESVKSVSDIYMPVSGKILAVNESLIDNSGIINEDSFEDGWIIRVEMSDQSELEEMMSYDEYEEFKAEEG